MLWLFREFSTYEKCHVFTPVEADFPIQWNGSDSNATDAMKIIARAMHIEFDDLKLELFEERFDQVNSDLDPVFIQHEEGEATPAGVYWDKNDEGKFEIGLERKNLEHPDVVVATLAHELCHVKLLGEKRIEENNEPLTDLTTIFFGFGIFTANVCFRFHKSYDRWGYERLGYLEQDQWSYALALFAYLRNEENENWSQFLSPNIKKDFDIALKYMMQNKDELFNFDKNG